MTPPAGKATTKPVDKPVVQPEGPAKTEEKKVEGKAEGKVEGKAEVKTDGKTEDKKDSGEDSYWTDGRNYLARFRIGPSWAGFNNGVSLFEDHSGWHLGLDLGLKKRFGPGNRFEGYGGLSYEHGSYSRDVGGGVTSKAGFDAIGGLGGMRYHIVPDWFSAGLEAFVGASHVGSDCTKTDEGYCDGLSGTIFNSDITGAQAYPLDEWGGRIGIGLPLSFVRDIFVIKPEFNFNLGHGPTIETVSQGKFTQDLNPTEFKLTFGIDLAPAIGWIADSVSGKDRSYRAPAPDREPEPKVEPDKKDVKTPKKDTAVEPPVKKEATVEENFKVLSGYVGNTKTAAEQSKKLSAQMTGVYSSNASAFGGREGKNAKIAEIAEASKREAQKAQLEELGAAGVIAKIEGQIAAMPAGADKTKAEKDLKAAKDEMKKNVHSAYRDYSKTKSLYERYARTYKATPKVEMDVDKPEGYGSKPAKRPGKGTTTKKPQPKKPEPKKPEPKKPDDKKKPPAFEGMDE